jgi:ABC-2 type transport system permease protein
MERRVDAIVHLRQDFSRRLRRPDGAPVQVIVNGVDANTARLVIGYVQGVWQKWLSSRRWRGAGWPPCRCRIESAGLVQQRAAQPQLLVPG